MTLSISRACASIVFTSSGIYPLLRINRELPSNRLFSWASSFPTYTSKPRSPHRNPLPSSKFKRKASEGDDKTKQSIPSSENPNKFSSQESRERRSFAEELPIFSAAKEVTSEPGKIEESAPGAEDVEKLKLFNQKLNRLVQEKKFDFAERMYYNMETRDQLTPDIFTFGVMLNCFKKEGNLKSIVRILQKMKSLQMVPNDVISNTVIDAFGKRGDTIAMMSFYNDMKKLGMRPSVVLYTCIIDSFGKNEEHERAMEYFRKMIEEGIEPNHSVFNSLIDSIGKKGDLALMESFINRMGDYGLKPNVRTLTSIIHIYGRRGEYDAMMKIFDTMKENWMKKKEGLADVEDTSPNEATFNAILGSLAQKLDTDMMIKKFKEMKEMEVNPNDITLKIMVDAFNRAGDPRTLEFLHELEERKTTESSKLISLVGNKGNLDFLWKNVAEKIKKKEYDADTISRMCNMLIRLYGLQFNTKRTEEVFKEMEALGPHVIEGMLATLLKGYAANGDTKKMKNTIQTMEERKMKFDADLYNIIIEGFREGHAPKVSKDYFDKMKKEGIQPSSSTFASLIKLCGDTKELDMIDIYQEEMRELKITPTEEIFFNAIDSSIRCGSDKGVLKAIESFFSMTRSALPWNTEVVSHFLNIIPSTSIPDTERFVIDRMKRRYVRKTEHNAYSLTDEDVDSFGKLLIALKRSCNAKLNKGKS